MKRFYIIFIGRVQGVGFRWTLVQLTHKYNLTGYCRNMINGNVEAEIQGNEANLEAFIKEVLENRYYIRIDDYSIKSINIVENESNFSVIG